MSDLENKKVTEPGSTNSTLLVTMNNEFPEFEPLRDAFERACEASNDTGEAPFQLHQVSLPELVEQNLGSIPAVQAVLIYPNPARELAASASAGKGGIEYWCNRASEVLAAVRGCRRKILLIDGHAALSAPQAFTEQMTERLGVQLDITVADADEESAGERDLSLVIADYALWHDRTSKPLLDELVASSLPLQSPTNVAVDSLMKLLGEADSVKSTTADELRDSKEENEILLLQLHQVQEELECYFLSSKQQANDNDQPTQRVSKLEQELARVRHDHELAKHALNQVRKSISWRVTSPLRMVLSPFTGKSGL